MAGVRGTFGTAGILGGAGRFRYRRAFAQFNSAMLVVDDQVRTAGADGAAGSPLIISVLDIQSVKV